MPVWHSLSFIIKYKLIEGTALWTWAKRAACTKQMNFAFDCSLIFMQKYFIGMFVSVGIFSPLAPELGRGKL